MIQNNKTQFFRNYKKNHDVDHTRQNKKQKMIKALDKLTLNY